MRFIPGQDSFSISYRGGRAFDDNFTVDFFSGRGQSVYDVDTGLQFGEYVPMVFGKSADDLSLQVKDSSRFDKFVLFDFLDTHVVVHTEIEFGSLKFWNR